MNTLEFIAKMTKYFTILVLAFLIIGIFPKPAKTTKAPITQKSELKVSASVVDPCIDLAGFKLIACNKAIKHGIEPAMFLAQIEQESGFNPKARSRSGAIGIAQIMPSTAKSWKVNPHKPEQALDKAAENMSRYVKTYKTQGHSWSESYSLALAAYNAGAGAVQRHKGIPPYPETQRYVKNIFILSKKYS